MQIQELVKKLNGLKITQTSYDVLEQLYEDDILTSEEFRAIEIVASEINRDQRRWYDLSTTVYKLPSGDFLGIRSVSDVKGNTEYQDVGHVITFMEMEEVPTVTYRIKKQAPPTQLTK